MKTKNISGLVLLTGLLAGGAAAAPASTTTLAAPTTPGSTPSLAAAATDSLAMPPPDQIITTAELPNVADLTGGAAAQGITIEKIASSAVQVTVVYGYPNGKTRVVAYQLPTAGSADPTPPLVTAPPAVVYEPPPYIMNDYGYAPSYPVYGYSPYAFRFNFEGGRRRWR